MDNVSAHFSFQARFNTFKSKVSFSIFENSIKKLEVFESRPQRFKILHFEYKLENLVQIFFLKFLELKQPEYPSKENEYTLEFMLLEAKRTVEVGQ